MKSFSKFIIEKKKGTAVASPAPGDPLNPKGRRKIDKKFSDPSNPPKVENPEAPKSKPVPKPEGVNQADVSKQAAKYRRAERVKGATGGKTTGSLSKGNLSFPGDRSGAYQKTKSDIEARRGFSSSKSGGLKADETSKFVNRSVRQQRTVKQGTPDPFDPKTSKAPSRPFKKVMKGRKNVSSTIPDPFKSSTSVPKLKVQGPEPKLTPGPAETEAIRNIKNKKVKTVPQTPVNKYIRTMQDQGRPVDPDFVGSQGPKASGAKPEMVSGKTASKRSISRFRAKTDAARDISKAKNADLDKALKNLISSGNVKKSKPSGPSSSIGFRQASKKFSKTTKQTKAAQARSATGDINLAGPSKGKISFPASKGSELAKKTFGKFSIDTKRGGLAKNSNIIDVNVKVDPPKKPRALSGTPKPPKPSSIKLSPARKTPALAAAAKNAPLTQAGLNKTLRGIGGRALGVAGAGYDAVSSYQQYRKGGDSQKRAGIKSLFRTGLGYAGGALGGLAGAIGGGGIGSAALGTAGMIGGYSAGTSLADWVLGQTRYERKKKAAAKAAVKAAAANK